MRVFLSVSAAMLVAAFAETPVQAQDGAFMWCQATVGAGRDKVTYYSGFYSAAADQADAKARAFKSEVEAMELSALAVSAKCMALADYDTAVASRDAAMRAAPGELLNESER
ncbi:MAG: hypothetical protein ACOYMK_03125 [Hyphomonadaceae bacterium]